MAATARGSFVTLTEVNDNPNTTEANLDRIADHFVNYLFDQYQGTRHVRRVSSWIGLILKGIQRAGAENVTFHRARQLTFKYRGQMFKARYNHKIRSRGGIEIVQVLPGRGSPDGSIVLQVGNLREAEDAYLGLGRLMDVIVGG